MFRQIKKSWLVSRDFRKITARRERSCRNGENTDHIRSTPVSIVGAKRIFLLEGSKLSLKELGEESGKRVV